MATIAACQNLHRDWLASLAVASGGRTFSTHESHWAWLPARRQLVLLYPDRISPAGIRPGLAEGARLGARSVSAWLNNAVGYSPLEAFGFHRGPQPLWMSAPVTALQQFSAAAAALDPAPAEISGPDADELAAGGGHPRTAWHLTARGEGKLTGRAWVFVPTQAEQRRQKEERELRRQQDRPVILQPRHESQGTATVAVAEPALQRKPAAGSLAGVFGLAVGPSSRRKGYGTALLSRAATVAATAGAGQLAINAAPLGLELCTARGFELIGRGQQLSLDLR